MKAFLIAFAVVVLGALATIAAVSFAHRASESKRVHETRPVAGFHRIDISGQAAVTLVQGEAEGVSFDAPASTRVRTDVENGELIVSIVGREWRWLSGKPSRAPNVTINFRDLDRLTASGAVTVQADRLKANDLALDLAGACNLRIGDLQASALRLDGSGATKMEVAGKVARQSVDLSGAGSYSALRLESDEASIDVSGAGKAVVNARNALAVDISGAGKVEYVGDPKLKQTVSGIGKVARREGS